MLQSHTHSQTFCLYLHLIVMEPTVDVACRVACGQDDRTMELLAVVGGDARHRPAADDEAVHAGLEVYLATVLQDSIAHVLYHGRQLVRADVWMGIHQNVRVGSVLAEHVQYLLHVAALLAPGVELAVGVGSRAALAE